MAILPTDRNYRLPEAVRPVRHEAFLSIDPEARTFRGRLRIDLRLVAAVDAVEPQLLGQCRAYGRTDVDGRALATADQAGRQRQHAADELDRQDPPPAHDPQVLERALDLDPSNDEAALHLFEAHVDAGREADAVQVLGAAGFMRDHLVEKAMRELRTLALLAGGADAARDDAWLDDDWTDGQRITGDVDAHGYGARPINLLTADL